MSLAILSFDKARAVAFGGMDIWGGSDLAGGPPTGFAERMGLFSQQGQNARSLAYMSAMGAKLPAMEAPQMPAPPPVAPPNTAVKNSPRPDPGLFSRPGAVLQNMVPGKYPKMMSVLGGNGAVGASALQRLASGSREHSWMVASAPQMGVQGVEVACDVANDPGVAAVVENNGEVAEQQGLAPPPPPHFAVGPHLSANPGIKQHSLYKTELCRSWEETGTCRYGSKCQFAHGADELRDVPRHPKYKTEICCTFATTGTCPYGRRCRFIHQNGPITAVGAKRTDDNFLRNRTEPKPDSVNNGVKLPITTRWPVRRALSDPMAPASRRLPVFVKLSMANKDGHNVPTVEVESTAK